MCARCASLLARLRFTRLVRVAPRRFCLLPPSREPNICSPRRLGCPSCASRRSLVPRDPNICSPHRLSCPSRSSCARLCRRVTRTSVLPVAPVVFPAFARSPRRATRTSVLSIALVASLAPHAHSPAGLLARAARARRLTTVARATRRLTTVAPRAVLLGLGPAQGRVCVRVTCSKKRGRGFLASKKSVV